MAFPTVTIVVDDFNRANGAVNAGAGGAIWDSVPVVPGAPIANIISNRMDESVGGAEMVTLAQFGPSVEFYWDIAGAATLDASHYLAAFFAFQGKNTAGFSGYALILGLTGTANEWWLNKYTAGAGASAGSFGTQAVAIGDSVGFSMAGSTITAYYKAAAGSWTQVGTPITDTTYNRAGYLGFELGSVALDNLSGGTPSTHYTAPMVIGGRGGGRRAAHKARPLVYKSTALQDVVPTTDKSGAAAITGGGSTQATGSKGGFVQTPEAGGLPMLETSVPYAHVFGGGNIVATFSLTAGPGAVTGGGSISAVGRKGGRAGAAITGRGSITVISGSGPNSRSGSSLVHGGGTTSGLGFKGIPVAIVLSGGGQVKVLGVGAFPRTGLIHAGGSIAAVGRKGGKSITVVTAAGRISVGTISSGAVIIPDTKQPTYIRIGQHDTAMIVKGRTTFMVFLSRNTSAVVKT